MVLRRMLLVGVAVCASGVAFAQEVTPATPATPAAPASAPQAATPAPPPADAKTINTEVVAQPATPAQASASAASNPLEGQLDADKIMAAQKAGYQIKNENGQTLLCRRDLRTGSRVRYNTSCLTAREWEQLQNDNAQILKSIERRPRMSNQ